MNPNYNVAFTELGPYQLPTQILQYPDHYVADPFTFATNDAAAITRDGRKIIPAGTVYPANDATAKGVVFYDADVTNGAFTGALIVHGFIKEYWMPTAPTTEAKTALPMIKFYPVVPNP